MYKTTTQKSNKGQESPANAR